MITAEIEAFIRTLSSNVQSDVRGIITQLSTGLDVNELQKLANLLRKHELTDLDYNKVLGYVFSGSTKFGPAWQKIVTGLAKSNTGVETQGLALYDAAIKQYLTADNALSVAKQLGLSDGISTTLKDLYESPLIKNALKGSQDPEKALLFAARAAEQISSDPTVKAIAKSVPGGIASIKKIAAGQYLDGWKSLDTLVLSNLDPSGKAANIFANSSSLAKDLLVGGTDLKWAIDAYKSDTADASGIILTGADTAQRVINSAAALAVRLGADKPTAEDVVRWTSVGTGCIVALGAGAAVGGVGAIAGAVTCGVAVVSAALELAFKEGPDTSKIINEAPLAVFSPTKEQMNVIALDAQRLLLLLRYVYGQTSYKDMTTRVSYTQGGLWLDPVYNYNKNPQITPGFTMVNVLGALAFNTGGLVEGEVPTRTTVGKLDDGTFLVWPGPNWGFYGLGSSGCMPPTGKDSQNTTLNPSDEGRAEKLYIMSGDVSATMVECLANEIREDLKKQNITITKHTEYVSWADTLGPAATNAPVLRADELLQFFKAVVTYDLYYNADNGIKPFLLGGGDIDYNKLPIRIRTVGTNQRLSFLNDNFNTNDAYSPYCWTNMQRGNYGKGQCHMLDIDLKARQEPAIREMAFIRLLSAFSYIHALSYKKGSYTSTSIDKIDNASSGVSIDQLKGKDVLRDLNINVKDSFAPYAIPVSPRPRIINNVEVRQNFVMLFRELQTRKTTTELIKTKTTQLLLKTRAANTAHKIATAVGVDHTVLGNLVQAQGVHGAIKGLLGQVTTIATYVKSCETAGGTPGFMRGGSALCCPSLYYDENVIKCGAGNTAKCHADCLNLSKYNYGVPPVVRLDVNKKPSFSASTSTAKLREQFISWKDYQQYLLLMNGKLPPLVSVPTTVIGSQATVDTTVLSQLQLATKNAMLVSTLQKQLQNALYAKNTSLVLSLVAKYTDAQVAVGTLPTAKTVYMSKTLPTDVLTAEKAITTAVNAGNIPLAATYIDALCKLRASYGIREITPLAPGVTPPGITPTIPGVMPSVVVAGGQNNLLIGSAIVLGIGVAGTVLYNILKK